MRDKTSLTICTLMLAIAAIWLFGSPPEAAASSVHPWWAARQSGLYISGLLAFGLMSIAMYTATRPAWLETPLGGLDRIYRLHKWLGISAGALALAHWLIEMSDDILKATIGRGGRVPRAEVVGVFDTLRGIGKDAGEWAIYLLLAMIALALWQRFPYRPWRQLHRAMPIIYLILALHAVLLTPAHDWQQPIGWLLAGLLGLGSYAALRTLLGHIGRTRCHAGTVLELAHPAPDILHVRCQMMADWPGHQAGQFVLVNFHPDEGTHPFTIANADNDQRIIEFRIKALGDYTRRLAGRLKIGDSVGIEGPYGRFTLRRQRADMRQTWIAGGIGITPFLAWLEALRSKTTGSANVSADLHYCTRAGNEDALLPELHALCAALPGVRLQVHQGPRDLLPALGQPAQVWFCGPTGLANAIREHCPGTRIEQEVFALR